MVVTPAMVMVVLPVTVQPQVMVVHPAMVMVVLPVTVQPQVMVALLHTVHREPVPMKQK